MQIKHFFDTNTSTLSYIVFDETSLDAVIIDPVLDYEPASVTTSGESLARLIKFVETKKLRIHYILETHAHADHLSGAHELVTKYFPSAKIGIGERICDVQETFKKIFNFPSSFKTDGSQFDCLFKDNQSVAAGKLSFQVLFTPGHTPACVSYLFKEAVFTGDALFMPDYGTGRCDFPDGDAHALYHSVVKRLYELPESTLVFVGHDYQPDGRDLEFVTSITESKKSNIQLQALTTENDFVKFRTARDATLSAPRLLYPSVQVNLTAGELPDPESNGIIYLKFPLTENNKKQKI